MSKFGRRENEVFSQSRRKIKEDRLRNKKELQEHEYRLNLKRDKTKYIVPVLGVIDYNSSSYNDKKLLT